MQKVIFALATFASTAWAQGVHVRCETDGAVTVCVNGNTATQTIVTEDSVRKDSISVQAAMKFFAVKQHKRLLKDCTVLGDILAESHKEMSEEQKRKCDAAADWLSDHGYTCYRDGHCEKNN